MHRKSALVATYHHVIEIEDGGGEIKSQVILRCSSTLEREQKTFSFFLHVPGGGSFACTRARTCFFPISSYAEGTAASTKTRGLSSSPRMPEAPDIIVPQTLRMRRESMPTSTATWCFWCCCGRGRCCDGCTAPRTAGIPEATRSLRAWSKRTRLAPVKVNAAIAALYSGPRWVLFDMYRAFAE